jgi:GT2 family glycosyltransferase
MDNRRVCVVIVTYNRKEYLKKLLTDLREQSYPPAGILVYDNFSQDGTPGMLADMGCITEPKKEVLQQKSWQGIPFYYYRNGVNSGGSGGFAGAFRLVQKLPCDCVWAMDDDVSPDKDCLEVMMGYLDEEARMCVPNRGDERFTDYAIIGYDLKNPRLFHISECKTGRIDSKRLEKPYVEVRDMTFEGPLMTMELIRQIGIPDERYFILFDDTDYAYRAGQVTTIRYITGAHLHKQIIPKDTGKWSWKIYYSLRNSVYFDQTHGETSGVRRLRPFLRIADLWLRAVGKGRFNRARWIAQAYRDGRTGRMGRTYEPGEIDIE